MARKIETDLAFVDDHLHFLLLRAGLVQFAKSLLQLIVGLGAGSVHLGPDRCQICLEPLDERLQVGLRSHPLVFAVIKIRI
jgi:hypothetical protein